MLVQLRARERPDRLGRGLGVGSQRPAPLQHADEPAQPVEPVAIDASEQPGQLGLGGRGERMQHRADPLQPLHDIGREQAHLLAPVRGGGHGAGAGLGRRGCGIPPRTAVCTSSPTSVRLFPKAA